MSDENFPDGVGKKIVDALKKKNEDNVDISTEEMIEENNMELDTASDEKFDFLDTQTIENDFEPANFESNYEPQLHMPKEQQYPNPNKGFEAGAFNYNIKEDMYGEPAVFNYQASPYNETVNKLAKQAAAPASQHIPPNVAVLRRLISQLPNGVTKQTGAQIIRQTMEALGISMNNVLHEAQQVQDGLNDSVKTCMYSVQEYKNNIKTLEKQVLDYQKQIAHLNDLISLFVMTDKTR